LTEDFIQRLVFTKNYSDIQPGTGELITNVSSFRITETADQKSIKKLSHPACVWTKKSKEMKLRENACKEFKSTELP
jgi:hypothetical protein